MDTQLHDGVGHMDEPNDPPSSVWSTAGSDLLWEFLSLQMLLPHPGWPHIQHENPAPSCVEKLSSLEALLGSILH